MTTCDLELVTSFPGSPAKPVSRWRCISTQPMRKSYLLHLKVLVRFLRGPLTNHDTQPALLPIRSNPIRPLKFATDQPPRLVKLIRCALEPLSPCDSRRKAKRPYARADEETEFPKSHLRLLFVTFTNRKDSISDQVNVFDRIVSESRHLPALSRHSPGFT